MTDIERSTHLPTCTPPCAVKRAVLAKSMRFIYGPTSRLHRLRRNCIRIRGRE